MEKEDLKERILGLLNDEDYKPLNITELVMIFSDTNKGKFSVSDIIKEMESKGELFINKKGKVGSLTHYGMAKGRFIAKSRGFGFVDIGDNDVYVGDRKS